MADLSVVKYWSSCLPSISDESCGFRSGKGLIFADGTARKTEVGSVYSLA